MRSGSAVFERNQQAAGMPAGPSYDDPCGDMRLLARHAPAAHVVRHRIRRHIFVLPALPRNASGTPVKAALIDLLLAHASGPLRPSEAG